MFASSRATCDWVTTLKSMLPPSMNSLISCDSRTLQEYKDDSGITPRIEKTLDCLKLLNVRIPQPDKIRDYLIYHFDMVYLLPNISEMACLKFGTQAQLSLELNQDPEDDEYIILYVRQDHYDESVMRQIKQIRKEYERMMAKSSGWFLLTTDFCPPGNINGI